MEQDALERMLRQQCESADSLSFAYGHHMLTLASRVLASMAKAMESGSLPHEPKLTAPYIVVHGYLAQYDAWLHNYMNGHVSSESKMYEEAVRLLQEQQSKMTNGVSSESKH